MPIQNQREFLSEAKPKRLINSPVSILPSQQNASMAEWAKALWFSGGYQSTTAIYNAFTRSQIPDPDFDPFDNIPIGYEQFADQFLQANTLQDVFHVKEKIDTEIKDRQILSQASGLANFSAGLVISFFDPFQWLVPASLSITSFKTAQSLRALREAARVGEKVIDNAPIVPPTILNEATGVGSATLLSQVLSESFIQQDLATKTAEESVFDVLLSTAFASFIGGIGGKLQKNEYKALKELFNEDVADALKDSSQSFDVPLFAKQQVAGLTFIDPTGTKTSAESAFGFEKLSAAFTPEGEALSKKYNDVPEFREIFLNLSQNSVMIKGNLDDMATPQAVELIEKRTRDQIDGLSRLNVMEQFINYRRRVAGKSQVESPAFPLLTTQAIRAGDALRKPFRFLDNSESKPMTFTEFTEQIVKAKRRYRPHNLEPSPFPEVNKLVRFFDEKIYGPQLEKMVEVGLLKEDIKADTDFIKGYLPQIWNREKIRAKQDQFIELLSRMFRKQINERNQELAKKEGREFIPVSDESVNKSVQKSVRNLLESPDGQNRTTDTSRFEQARQLHLPDEMLDEFEDFLESDLFTLNSIYFRSTNPDIVLKEKFGDVGMKDQIKLIDDKYEDLIRNATSEKERQRLSKTKKDAIRLIEAMRDRVRGVHHLPKNADGIAFRISKGLRQLNQLRMLGNVTVSSLNDIFAPMIKHGPQSLPRLMSRIIANPKRYIQSAGEAQKLAGIYELMNNQRFNELAELTDQYLPRSNVERGLNLLSDSFGFVSLIAPWNHYMKTMAAFLTMDNALTVAGKISTGKRVGKRKLATLKKFGLDEDDLRGIWGEFQKHGEEHSGNKLAQAADWENKELADRFANFIRAEVDTIIITPTYAQRPLWVDDLLGSPELGRHVFQFRSFGFAALNAITVSGLQQRDASVLGGVALSVFMGANIYALKQIQNGKEISNDPATLFQEGLDRSGVLGILSDISTIKTQMTGGALGIHRLTGADVPTRYRAQNTMGLIAGPTFGLAEDFITSAYWMGRYGLGETPSQAQIRASFRLLPHRRTLGLRHLFDATEEGFANALGASGN